MNTEATGFDITALQVYSNSEEFSLFLPQKCFLVPYCEESCRTQWRESVRYLAD